MTLDTRLLPHILSQRGRAAIYFFSHKAAKITKFFYHFYVAWCLCVRFFPNGQSGNIYASRVELSMKVSSLTQWNDPPVFYNENGLFR